MGVRTFHCLLKRKFSSQKVIKNAEYRANFAWRSAGGAFAAAQQPPFPCQRMGDDGVEVLELRAPIESRANALDIGHQGRRIAGAASAYLHREVATACTPHRIDYLEHRRPAAIAAVECRAGAAAPQIGERRRMRTREIANMDVVADAGAVLRRVVGAEHVDLG